MNYICQPTLIYKRMECIKSSFNDETMSITTPLILKIFKCTNMNVSQASDFNQVLHWSIDDWYDFIPYISINVVYTHIYKNILSYLMFNDILLKGDKLNYKYYALFKWCTSPCIGNDMFYLFKQNIHPFHIYPKVYIDKPACSYCIASATCMFNGTSLGFCCTTFKCYPHFGMHVCKNHSKYIDDISFNSLGLTDRYITSDGRIFNNISVFKCVPDCAVVKWKHSYNLSLFNWDWYNIDPIDSYLEFDI
jgi:hypothetical protein